ncbi:hypothetical protein M8J77_016202 [Diaphorina citri]|nr:hypothetical protein M8J77_016202 [Diaphorina citri]
MPYPSARCQYPYLYHTTEEDGVGGEGLELYKECIKKAGGIGEFDNYKFGHAFSTSLAMPRDELAGFRSEATEFS